MVCIYEEISRRFPVSNKESTFLAKTLNTASCFHASALAGKFMQTFYGICILNQVLRQLR